MSKSRKTIAEQIVKLLSDGDQLDLSLLDNFDNDLLGMWKESLRVVQEDISKIFKKYGDKPSWSDLFKEKRLAKLEKLLQTQITNLTSKSNKLIEKSNIESYSQGYTYTGYVGETTFQADLGFPEINENQILSNLANSMDRITWKGRNKDNANFLVKNLKQYLTNAFNEGVGYGQTAREFDDKFGIGYSKAKTILRTEGHRASQLGRVLGFEEVEEFAKDVNMDAERHWDATLDSKTRLNHGAMEGVKPDPKTKLFKFVTMKGNLIEVIGPGATNTTDDINCRCTISMRIANIPPKIRRDNETKKVIPYKSYPEWYEAKYDKKLVLPKEK